MGEAKWLLALTALMLGDGGEPRVRWCEGSRSARSD